MCTLNQLSRFEPKCANFDRLFSGIYSIYVEILKTFSGDNEDKYILKVTWKFEFLITIGQESGKN